MTRLFTGTGMLLLPVALALLAFGWSGAESTRPELAAVSDTVLQAKLDSLVAGFHDPHT